MNTPLKGGEKMNAITILQNHSTLQQAATQSKSSSSNDNQSVFGSILGQANDNQATAQNIQSMMTPEALKELLRLLESENVEVIGLEELNELLLGFGMESLSEDQLVEIKQLINDDSMNLSMDTKGNHLIDPLSHPLPFNIVSVQSSSQVLSETEVLTQLYNLFNEFKALLGKVSSDQDLSQMAPKILELLEKWTALESKHGHLMENIRGLTDSREGKMWSELLQTFQKRHQFALSQQYHSNATITSKDIANWLSRAISAQTQLEQAAPIAIDLGSSMPMSKLEQYVIHMQQGQGTQSVDKQMIDQFQNVINSSRFLTLNNGFKQLAITLRPENLGEMMVRLTEINGEMTVKILVSSQATRQMLESNIHQLKNMFAPHQVVIEETNDWNVQRTSEEQEQQDQLLDDHDEQENSEQSHKDQSKESDLSFHDVLMNEKV